ncbi:Transposase [Paraburkholderia hospita]|nr:Transposase [Paraburkholderia hospita]
MNATGTITMTMREVDRFKVIQAVTEARLKPGHAAERLGLGVRQVERLVRRYEAAGVAGLVSGKRGRPGNHQLPAGKAQRALALIRERYPDFGPTLACEKLRECHGIELAVETVRTLMRAAGLWIPRRERAPKVYQPRNRRACLGELIQIDGSDHRWFEDRAPACTLLVFIDDATGRLMALHFTAMESTFSSKSRRLRVTIVSCEGNSKLRQMVVGLRVTRMRRLHVFSQTILDCPIDLRQQVRNQRPSSAKCRAPV